MTIDGAPAARARRGRFFADRRGVAAIEFALVVPMLIVLYLGSVDLCLGITLHRKVQHAGSLMNDLATRENNLKKADLDGIIDMGNATLMPRASRLSTAKLTGIYVDDQGKATVRWSHARQGDDGKEAGADTKGSSIALPANLSSLRKKNIVMTSVTYKYTPIGSFGFVSPFVMTQDVFAAARVGESVVCSDC